jgi:hypothetical protein
MYYLLVKGGTGDRWAGVGLIHGGVGGAGFRENLGVFTTGAAYHYP